MQLGIVLLHGQESEASQSFMCRALKAKVVLELHGTEEARVLGQLLKPVDNFWCSLMAIGQEWCSSASFQATMSLMQLAEPTWRRLVILDGKTRRSLVSSDHVNFGCSGLHLHPVIFMAVLLDFQKGSSSKEALVEAAAVSIKHL